MPKTPQVALLVETARGFGREISMGVARYSSLHGPWSFLIAPGEALELAFPQMEYWEGDGVIARLESPAMVEGVLNANLPTIALDMTDEQTAPESPLSKFTELLVDSAAAANLAAEHLLERGYPNYAFVGTGKEVWSKRRQVSFQARVKKAGFETTVYSPPADSLDMPWEQERTKLAEWLDALPKPVGVMSCNDIRGRQVLDACRLADIEVPKQVAVVGVDNDELFCELACPTLTSVALNTMAAGYAAAERLDKMMRGKARKPKKIVVQALRVIPRGSTNAYAIEDEGVAAALAFIQQTKGNGISVPLVADHAKLARRDLDVRFRECVGHTVVTEIQRVRLDHAKRLLEETDYPIPEVAEAAGYASASYMVQVFRQRLDQTPAKYRASVRLVSAQARPLAGLPDNALPF